MDTIFAEAVTQITALPPDTQRAIGAQLLNRELEANLPVIQFEAE